MSLAGNGAYQRSNGSNTGSGQNGHNVSSRHTSIMPFPQLPQRDANNYPPAMERSTPQSLEAEQSTLGAMMMERRSIAVVLEILSAEDFYRELHRKIFAGIIAIYERAEEVDLISLVEELRLRGELDEVGGAAYMNALIQACPSAANVLAYARPVQEAAARRRLIEISESLKSLCYSPEGLDVLGGESVVTAICASTLPRITRVMERTATSAPPSTITGADLARMEIPPMRWVVPGLIPEGLSILGGMMKQGKSWMAYGLSLAVAMGGRFLGKLEVERGEVLYLALEDPWRRLQDRQTKLLRGDAPPARLHLQREWPLAHQGGIERIERWLAQHPDARLVVIDVLQKFRKPRKAGGDLYAEDYEALGMIKDLADRHGVAVLVLHHMSKAQVDDPFLALSGTVGVSGSADGLFALERKRHHKLAVLHYTGREIESGRKAIEWDNATYSWTLLGEAEEFEEKSLTEKIFEALRGSDEPMSPKGVATELQEAESSVRTTLGRMADSGEIRKTARGYYTPTFVTRGRAAARTEAPASPVEAPAE